MYYYGHGLAFVISPTLDLSQADEGGYLGVFNSSNNGLPTNHILAIELDTDQNHKFNDIDGSHVGIDVNSVISNESASTTYFSENEGYNESILMRNADPVQVWIDYNGEEKLLNVTLAPITVSKPNRPLLSKPVDLSQILLDSMYVGFSAATEMGGDKQYILGWSLNSGGPAQNLDISKLPPPTFSTTRASKSKGNQSLIIILTVLGVAVLIAMGVAIYVARMEKYKKICEDSEREYSPGKFTYTDIDESTKGFKDKQFTILRFYNL